MKALIDADILLYEIGFSGEFVDEEGDSMINSFDRVAELLDKKIDLICYEVESDVPPTLYLTGDRKLVQQLNKWPVSGVIFPEEYQNNFRYDVAVTKGYKSTRKSNKPFHYYNLRAYIVAKYDCVVTTAWEADDQMAMDQYTDMARSSYDEYQTIICSRDKDLRMVRGWHYSWECGKQASMGPVYTDKEGWLFKDAEGKTRGYGDRFFYYQLLVGDVVDSIPGLPKVGDVKAFKELDRLFKNEYEVYSLVKSMYMETIGDDWQPYMKEQAYLLWMVREVNPETGELVMWRPPTDGKG